jgi:hypothetical protein
MGISDVSGNPRFQLRGNNGLLLFVVRLVFFGDFGPTRTRCRTAGKSIESKCIAICEFLRKVAINQAKRSRTTHFRMNRAQYVDACSLNVSSISDWMIEGGKSATKTKIEFSQL